MNPQRMLIGTLTALTIGAAGAQAITERNGILTTSEGQTLYVFTKDAPGKSNCNGACVSLWPPYLARERAPSNGVYSVVTRDDGSVQWAHNGRPLYFYAPDARPGDMKGEGQGGVWFVIKAAAAQGAASWARTTPARYTDQGGY